MRSNNPIFSNQAFQTYDYSVPRTGLMTVQGTVSKTFLLLAILTATAIWSWAEAARGAATMPLVMGAVGQTQQQQGLNAGGLANLLGGEQQQADSMLGGLATQLLDQNNDGSIVDDVMKMGSNLLGGLFGRK